MGPVSRRTLNYIYSMVLLAIVFLSWGFVIYACMVTSQWLLVKNHPDVTFHFWI